MASGNVHINLTVKLQTVKIICKVCKSDLTNRSNFMGYFSCDKCDTWTNNFITEVKPFLPKGA